MKAPLAYVTYSMLLPSIILLCFNLQHCIGENSSQIDAVTTEIGKGVEAKVYIVYDTKDYATKYTHHEHRKSGVVWYFIKLFESVQRYFHHKNVKAIFSVIGVELNNTLWIRTNDSLDTNATLENVQKALPVGYSRPNETIVYFITKAHPDATIFCCVQLQRWQRSVCTREIR
ncbi:uncharacterized protein LOC119185497 [Rhipicephalus microplus]|uniref:uncharacterized protein LOC119185497 n=1 Tax=Rhipicephalus microplus TaxID=6941 RepID=UPI003F6BA87E